MKPNKLRLETISLTPQQRAMIYSDNESILTDAHIVVRGRQCKDICFCTSDHYDMDTSEVFLRQDILWRLES